MRGVESNLHPYRDIWTLFPICSHRIDRAYRLRFGRVGALYERPFRFLVQGDQMESNDHSGDSF